MTYDSGGPPVAGIPDRDERLRIAMDAGDVGTWEWILDSGEVRWTETLERIHGFEPGAFGGSFDVYQQYIHEEDRERVFATIETTIANLLPYQVEYRMYKPDGTLHWVSARGRVFTDADGKPHSMMGICMDVTERRQATDALRLLTEISGVLASSLEYEKTLANVAHLAVPQLGDWCVVDVLQDDGRLLRLATAHSDPQKEALARELESKFPAKDDAPNGPQRVVRTGVLEYVPEIPVELLRANAVSDEHLDVLLRLAVRSYICLPLVARGRTLGAITIVNDDSRRSHTPAEVQLAEELASRAAVAVDNARLYRRSVEASRARDEFLATLSHELKSPITAALGYASLLESGTLTAEETVQAIDAIKMSAKAQARLVEDILEVSRGLMGKVRLDLSSMDLVAAVRAAADAITPSARAKEVSVRVTGDMHSLFVVADPNRIQQVLWNLTSNALKFTPRGGEISMSVSHDERGAVVSVRDDGSGIDADLLPHVFERFRQGGAGEARGGLGLGLSIVKHLVELHTGTIEAFSEGEGRGATFTFTLPLLPEMGRQVESRAVEVV